MPKRLSRTTCLAAIMVAMSATGFMFFFSGQKAQAQPQGLMSAPACQCSPTTPIASMSTTVVHCICGGISCVISEHKEQGKNTNLMQCVK
jgi:hypothetical protein